jgi:hypothetical protein
MTPIVRPSTLDDLGPNDTCDACDNYPFIVLEVGMDSHQFCLSCASSLGLALRTLASSMQKDISHA